MIHEAGLRKAGYKERSLAGAILCGDFGSSTLGSDEYVELRTQGCVLSIVSKRSADIFCAGAAEPAANRSVIFDFQVEDVDKERSRLQNLVCPFVLEPTDQPWGNRSMLFRDPDGKLINFFAPRPAS